MYTLKKDTKITAEIINAVIEYNESIATRFTKLNNIYLGKHDILNREKDGVLSNNRVVVNHAKYITDTNVGYLLGNPVNYLATDDINIDAVLKEYKRQTITDLDSEIAKSVSIMGLQREYVYANENAEPRSCVIDNRNSVIVYDDTVEHKKMFGIIYRELVEGDIKESKNKTYEVIVVDKASITTYHSKGKKVLTKQGKEKPHTFGDVPIIEYRNNPELLGDFEPVISLIDAYNLLQSDRINDKEQLVDAILVLYGATLEDAQMETLKSQRYASGLPNDSKMEYLIKQLQESDVDVLRKNVEADIHKISMTPNMSDQNFVGNSSGVAIRYKLLAFEQNIKNKERYMERGLVERLKLYINFLSTKSNDITKDIPVEDIDVVFKRNLPSNDLETSQIINNLVDLVDSETLLSQISFIKDAKEIMEAKVKEDEAKPKPAFDPLLNANEINDANGQVQSKADNLEEKADKLDT